MDWMCHVWVQRHAEPFCIFCVDVEEEIVDSRKVIASESANKTVQNHMELFAFAVMP